MRSFLPFSLLAFLLFAQPLAAQLQYQWVRSMGGVGNMQDCWAAADEKGNSYVTGVFVDFVDFDGTTGTDIHNQADGTIFFISYDKHGNYRWGKNFGGTSFGIQPFDIEVDHEGFVYLTGFYSATADFDPGPATHNLAANWDYDFFVAKYDSLGNYVWAKGFATIDSEYSNAITFDSNNNFYITGGFNSTLDFDPGPGSYPLIASGYDSFLAKYTSDGNFIWARQLKADVSSVGHCIKVDRNDDPVVTGRFYDTIDLDASPAVFKVKSHGMSDIFLARYDKNGNFKNGGSAGSTGEDYAQEIVTDSANIYFTGFFSNQADIDLTTDTLVLNTMGIQDVFLVSIDTTLALNWVHTMGSAGDDDYAEWLQMDRNQKIYVGGKTQGIMTYTDSSGSHTLGTTGTNNIFVLRYQASGETDWTYMAEGNNDQQGGSITLDGFDNLYLTAFYRGTVFTSGDTLESVGDYSNVYLIKFDSGKDHTGVNDHIQQDAFFSVFPNPASQTLNCVSDHNNVWVRIFNATGHLVTETKISQGKTFFDLSAFESGTYLVQAISNTGTSSQKIILIK